MALMTMAVLLLQLGQLFSIAVAAAVASGNEQDDHPTNLRQRQLPGNEGFKGFEGMMAGGSAMTLLVVVAVVLLCCCLCSGGRWSLCDILACVCIYELCCDDGNIGGFRLF
jgi:hypothetical protein